jgi:hypothetical protein
MPVSEQHGCRPGRISHLQLEICTQPVGGKIILQDLQVSGVRIHIISAILRIGSVMFAEINRIINVSVAGASGSEVM